MRIESIRWVECHDKSVDESDTDMPFRHVMTLSIYLVFSLCMEVYFLKCI
jgi:hypothetical protein